MIGRSPRGAKESHRDSYQTDYLPSDPNEQVVHSLAQRKVLGSCHDPAAKNSRPGAAAPGQMINRQMIECPSLKSQAAADGTHGETEALAAVVHPAEGEAHGPREDRGGRQRTRRPVVEVRLRATARHHGAARHAPRIEGTAH